MDETRQMQRRGVPWPVWAGLGALLLGLVGLAAWQMTEEPARAAEEEVAAEDAGAQDVPVTPVADAAVTAEQDKALVQLVALDDARSRGAALADEVSRLRWALLDERRQCVIADPPPPRPELAEAEEPVIEPPEPAPPEPEVAEPEEPEPAEPVVVAVAEPPAEPEQVAVAPAPPPPPPPLPPQVPVREQAPPPPPPPPPSEPVVVAEAAPQVAATTTTPAAVPPGCPPPRPPEEAPEVVFVLDASESMMIPYGAEPGIDDQLQAISRQGPMGASRAEQMFQALLNQGGTTRIDRAKQALMGVIRSTPADVDMGFISFHDCGDVRNFGYYGSQARGSLTNRVGVTQVGRGTPLADSMIAGGSLIRGGRSASDPAYMVVVTDGNDSCGGNPCAVAQRLKSLYPGLVINVIDLSGTANLQCVANITGGRLVRPEGSGGLTSMVQQATGQASVPAHCLQ